MKFRAAFMLIAVWLLLLSSCSEDGDFDDLQRAIILSKIQSITVVPTVSDGSVGLSNAESKIRFRVEPLSVAEHLPSIGLEAFMIETIPTELNSTSGGGKLPIRSIQYENNLLVVTTSGETFPESFFDTMKGVPCRLNITDGINIVSSSIFNLIPDNTKGGFFFRLRDETGHYYYPFHTEDGVIHVSISHRKNINALFPVFTSKDVFIANDSEITGKQAFDFSDFTEPFTFRQINPNKYEKEWTVQIYDLPVLMMDTPNMQPIVSKTDRVEGTDMRIVEDGVISSMGTAGVRGRGNSSWLLDKKPYNIKLDKKYPVLGMEDSKSWILLANAYYDRTQLHNATAFEMARLTDYPWVQSGKFVELFLNGEHRGLYYLCEKIREGKKAINIGDGFLLESAVSDNRISSFVYSDYYNDVWNGRWALGWEIKAPDGVSTEQYVNIKNALNKMESQIRLEEITHSGQYRDYYDIDTAIDWLLVEEAALNEEASRSKNIYMYIDDSGKFKMGPPWDFDAWTFGLYGTGHFYCTSGTMYYQSLLKDAFFVSRLQEKWAHIKPIWLNKIPDFIDSQYEIIRRAAERNDIMWPEWCPENKAKERTYKQSVESMKDSFVEQINWMDAKIQNKDFSN